MLFRLTKLLLIFSLVSTQAYGQFFEGKIVYTNTYKSKLPNLTDQQLTTMMGTTQEYFIKGGNYKSVAPGALIQWQLYSNKDNKLYTKMGNSTAVLWNDGAENKDELVKAELNRGVIKVLGHTCDELILTTKLGVQKYYFSNELKVDATLYEQHNYFNWNEYLALAKALPLKMYIEHPHFVLEGVAVEIKPMALDDKLFELPAGVKLEKNPF